MTWREIGVFLLVNAIVVVGAFATGFYDTARQAAVQLVAAPAIFIVLRPLLALINPRGEA